MPHTSATNRLNLSIVIPTYNGARFLREALESVFAQTQLPREIIVVDDCSTDGTAELAESLAAGAPVPLQVIRLETNSGGPSRPINVGVAAATSAYVGVLDQDDIYAPGVLGLAVAALEAAPECSVAFYWVGDFDRPEDGPRQTEETRRQFREAAIVRGEFLELPASFLVKYLALEGMFTSGYPGFVFRRESWPGANESLKIAGDMEAMGGLLRQGNGVLAPTVGYFRRCHDANASLNRPRMCYEIGLVLAHLSETSPCLQSPPAVAEQIRGVIRGLAYSLRQGHYYREATDLYRVLGRLGESRSAVLSTQLKLQVHKLYAKLFRRAPEYSQALRPSGIAVTR